MSVAAATSSASAADFVGEKNAMGAANELLSASGIWGIWGMVKVGIDAAVNREEGEEGAEDEDGDEEKAVLPRGTAGQTPVHRGP